MIWQIKKLGEICDFQNGFAFKSSEYVDSGFFVMRIGNVQDGYISLSDPKYIKKSYKSFERFILQSGDILISLTGNVGRVGVINNNHLPAVINQRVARVVLKSDNFVQKQFLLYFLESSYFKEELINAGHGAAQQNISTRDIENLEIPLPSPQEQTRIIKILDEVFSKLEITKNNAEKNLQNSKALFESYLQSVFINSKYEYKPLGNVCEVIGGGTPSKTGSNFAKFYDGSIPWATVRDMRNEIITETEHKITKEAVEDSSTNIIPKGNVVIATRVGLGKVCLIENDTAINQDLRGIVPTNKDKLLVGYLFQWLKSIAHVIKEEGTGATVQGVKLPFIKSLLIPVPKTLAEQKSIVKKLDDLSEQTKKLEEIYKKKLADLEELKKSVLKKAFSGEL